MSSREHFQQTYYELRELAEGGNSTTYLAVSKQEVAAIRAQGGTKKHQEAMVRQKAVVIKVPRSGYSSLTQATDDLRCEIKVLTKGIPQKHNRIVEALDYHDDEDQDIVWLSMPYIPGRAVGSLKFYDPEALSQRLIWHVGYQILEALKFMAFGPEGTSDTTPMPGWQPVSHGDIHAHNLMFTPGKPFALPDIVLIDFGLTTPGVDSQGGFDPIFSDLYTVGEMLEDMVTCSDSPDLAINDNASKLRTFIEELKAPADSDWCVDFDHLAALFDVLLASASAGRDSADRTLPEPMLVARMFDDVRSSANVDPILSAPAAVDEPRTRVPDL